MNAHLQSRHATKTHPGIRNQPRRLYRRRNSPIDFLVMDKEGETLMADFFAKIETTVNGPQDRSGRCEIAQEWRDAGRAGHGES